MNEIAEGVVEFGESPVGAVAVDVERKAPGKPRPAVRDPEKTIH